MASKRISSTSNQSGHRPYFYFPSVIDQQSRDMSLVRTSALLRTVLRRPLAAPRRAMSGGAWNYRMLSHPPPKFYQNWGTAIGAVTWWWILWGIMSEPDHLLGEFPYPDPSQWTDQELGIPPDDAE